MHNWKLSKSILTLLLIGNAVAQNSENVVKGKIDAMSVVLIKGFAEQNVSHSRIIAVKDFDNIGQEAEDLKIGETVAELINQTFAESPLVKVTDRKNMDQIMEEMAMKQAGIFSSESDAEMGLLLGAEYMVVGSVAKAGNYFNVNARIIEASSAEVLTVGFTEIEANNLIAVSSEMFDLRKGRVLATGMSVIPGMGQWFNGKLFKGFFYVTAVAASVGGAVVLQQMGDDAYSEYQENTREGVERYNTAEQYYKDSQIVLFTAAGIWLFNLFDAWWDAGALKREVRRAKKAAKKGIKVAKKRKDRTLFFMGSAALIAGGIAVTEAYQGEKVIAKSAEKRPPQFPAIP